MVAVTLSKLGESGIQNPQVFTINGLNHRYTNLLFIGVTSFCPTLVTSPSAVYFNILPHIPKRAGGLEGAEILGVHVEGPFISKEKKGAHPPEHILELEEGFRTVQSVYGDLVQILISIFKVEGFLFPWF